MRIAIVCKVIDNFGDAGFCLRLSKAMAKAGHQVFLLHDHPDTLQLLYPTSEVDTLELIEASSPNFHPNLLGALDMIIEPFGTSSEQTRHRYDLDLKIHQPTTPWLVIDYLSAEGWIENFHLTQSLDPSSGHQSTFFYPGFTPKTGGLIHGDYPANLLNHDAGESRTHPRIFVFAYPNAPLKRLAATCEKINHEQPKWRIDWASANPGEANLTGVVRSIGFCRQSAFDHLLANYDVLFVRGEDSFVRAQLAGKPMIWQIYPTKDNAHENKLRQFFELYSTGLGHQVKDALWNVWCAWNCTSGAPGIEQSWLALMPHLQTLKSHAIGWRNHLQQGPELVSEILTWRSKQSPTL
jgi:uncharacterized repeat protein (TIGR03837 family)